MKASKVVFYLITTFFNVVLIGINFYGRENLSLFNSLWVLLLIFWGQLISILVKLIFKKNFWYVFSSVTNLLMGIIWGLLMYNSYLYENKPAYECISEEERSVLTPSPSEKSFSIPGVYVLHDRFVSRFTSSNASKHKFHFLSDTTCENGWKKGVLVLEVIPKENVDTVIYVKGAWKLENNDSLLLGDMNYLITTSMVSPSVSTIAQHSFEILCRESTMYITLKMKDMDLGGVHLSETHDVNVNQLFDYLKIQGGSGHTEYYYKKVKDYTCDDDFSAFR